MNTSVLKKEDKIFSPKQILLTLKKGFGQCPMTVAIAPIGTNKNFKITDKKLMEINSQDARCLFTKEMENSDKIHVGDQSQSKLTQVAVKNRYSLLRTEQCSVFESKACTKFSKISGKGDSGGNFNAESNETDSGCKNLGSILNRTDRFVPNILRSTKMGENSFNWNGLTQTMSGLGKDERCNDERSLKRKRKQVLRPLNIKRDCTRRTRILRKKCQLKRNRSSVKKSGAKARKIAKANVEQENKNNDRLETEKKTSATVEEPKIDSCDRYDLYSADLDVFHATQDLPSPEKSCGDCTDKSIEKIFAEFEVADYQDYIASEDLGFDVNEMDKLFGSDIDDLHIESPILRHCTEKVEYDVNGNDIDNYGDASTKQMDENQLRPCDMRCEIKPYHDDGTEHTFDASSNLEYAVNFGGICSDAWDDASSYQTSEINLWSNDFEDCYSDDDFHDFRRSITKELSSCDTASEPETNEFNSTKGSSLALSKNEKPDCCTSSLTVTEAMPDHVFSNDDKEFCLEGFDSDADTHQPVLNSSPIIQRYNSNDDIHFNTSAGEPLVRSTSNLNLFDCLDETLQLLEDGNFLVDNTLSINCAVSNKDETCETILANSNAKFNDNSLLSICNDVIDVVDRLTQSKDSNDLDTSKSISPSSPPFLIEQKNANENKMSRLESALTRSPSSAIYPRPCYLPKILCDLRTDSKNTDNEHRSVYAGYSKDNIFDFTISPGNSVSSQVTGSKEIQRASYSNLSLAKELTGKKTGTNSNDDYSVTERRNDRLFESASPPNRDSDNYRSSTDPVSSKVPKSSSKRPSILRKSKQGLRKDLAKRSEYVALNISYFPCDFCDKHYSFEADLVNHMEVTHQCRPSRFGKKTKKYVCDKCSKEYCLAGAIEKHFQLHENYVLTCRMCEKHFSEKIYLKRHVNSAHLDWKSECNYCGRKFPRKNALTRHLKLCHGLQNLWPESIV